MLGRPRLTWGRGDGSTQTREPHSQLSFPPSRDTGCSLLRVRVRFPILAHGYSSLYRPIVAVGRERAVPVSGAGK